MAISLPSGQIGAIAEAPSETSTTVPMPTTVNANDLLIHFGSQKSLGSTVYTPNSGWTQREQFSCTSSTQLPLVFIQWKWATGTEGGTNLTVAHTSGAVSSHIIVAVSGVDQTTPFDVADTTVDHGASLTTDLPSQPLTMAGCAQFVIAAHNTTTNTVTAPSGFTELASRVANVNDWQVSWGSGLSSGASGTRTVTWSPTSSRGVGAMIALRPAITVTNATVTFPQSVSIHP